MKSKTITVICPNCGKPFKENEKKYNHRLKISVGKMVFCSIDCYSDNRRGRRRNIKDNIESRRPSDEMILQMAEQKTRKEIAAEYNVTRNRVGMWITRARKNIERMKDGPKKV